MSVVLYDKAAHYRLTGQDVDMLMGVTAGVKTAFSK